MSPALQRLKAAVSLRSLGCLSIALLIILGGNSLRAQEMIAGNGVLTSTRGDVSIKDTSGSKVNLRARDTIIPGESTWSTDAEGRAYLSLSNGVGVGIDHETEITFIEYLQRPFDSDNQGFDYEPSVSNLQIQLASGRLALASNQLSPLSELRVQLPIGSLRVHKGTCLIETSDLGLHIEVIDGNLTYYYPDGESREFVTPENPVRITELSARRQQVADWKEKTEQGAESHSLIEATVHSSRRVFYKANSNSGEAPEPVIVVRPEYFKQPSVRPYQFKE